MKLRLISEIQRKSPTTNMDRSNVTGVYGVASVNDFFHLVHPGSEGHAKKDGGEESKPDNEVEDGKVS